MASNEKRFEELKKIAAFTFFPSLPAEIQLKIWKKSVAQIEDCVIPITVEEAEVNVKDPLLQDKPDFKVSTGVKPSGLLAACTMSREAILSLHTGFIKSATGGIIRFDSSNDTIMLLDLGIADAQPFRVVAEFLSRNAKTIRHLAIDAYSFTVLKLRDAREHNMGREFSHFKELASLSCSYAYDPLPCFNYRSFVSAHQNVRFEPLDFEEVLKGMKRVSPTMDRTAASLERGYRAMLEGCMSVFQEYKQVNPDWSIPKLRMVRLV